jgi:hypothetical protein
VAPRGPHPEQPARTRAVWAALAAEGMAAAARRVPARLATKEEVKAGCVGGQLALCASAFRFSQPEQMRMRRGGDVRVTGEGGWEGGWRGWRLKRR